MFTFDKTLWYFTFHFFWFGIEICYCFLHFSSYSGIIKLCKCQLDDSYHKSLQQYSVFICKEMKNVHFIFNFLYMKFYKFHLTRTFPSLTFTFVRILRIKTCTISPHVSTVFIYATHFYKVLLILSQISLFLSLYNITVHYVYFLPFSS